MRQLLYITIGLLLFASCKKKDEQSPIIGQWNWVKATGGIGNIYQTPQNSGLSWQLTLNPNFSATQSGSLMTAGNGTFTLTEDTDPVWPRHLLHITLGNEVTTYSYSFLSNDTLRLDNRIEVDGLTYFLVRE